MTSFNIRSYDSAPTKLPKRAKPARDMNAHERRLNTFAAQDAFSGLVLIWHQNADGEYTKFDALMPDAGVMASVGEAASSG